MEFVIASLKVVLVQNFTLRSAKPCNNIKILLSKQAAPPFFNSISTKIVNKKKKESLLAVDTYKKYEV